MLFQGVYQILNTKFLNFSLSFPWPFPSSSWLSVHILITFSVTSFLLKSKIFEIYWNFDTFFKIYCSQEISPTFPWLLSKSPDFLRKNRILRLFPDFPDLAYTLSRNTSEGFVVFFLWLGGGITTHMILTVNLKIKISLKPLLPSLYHAKIRNLY